MQNQANRYKNLKYGATVAGVLGIAAGAYYLLNSDLADHEHDQSTIKKPSPKDPNFNDYFQNKKGLFIFTRSEIPVDPTAVIFLIHGMSEHSGRTSYAFLKEKFLELNFAVFALDHQGHGKSSGNRVHVATYHDFLDDIEQFIKISLAKEEVPSGIPVFIFGHSMGGALTLGTLLHKVKSIPNLRGAIISSGAVNVHKDKNYSEVTKMIGRHIAYYLPKLEVVPPRPTTNLSRNLKVCEDFGKDPLNNMGGIKAGFGNQLILLSEELDQKFEEIQTPLLIFHGGKDTIVDVSAAHVLYKSKASEGQKTIKIFDEMLHEIWEDPEKDDAVTVLLDWLKERL